MEQRHKDAIQRNFTTLVERTDLDSIVTALFERGVFSEQMIEPYQDPNESSRSRKRKLYREITHRGPNAFGHLVDVLSEMGYWDIVRDLDPNSPFSNINIRASPIIPNHIIKRDPAPRPTEEFLSIPTEKEKDKKNRTKLEAELHKTAGPVPAPAPADADNAVYTPPFTVVKSTRFEEDDGDPNKLRHYRTRGRQRGMLVLLSYIDFLDNIEDSRKGARRDNDNLMYLFSEFGIKTLKYLNLTKQETIDTLSSLEQTLAGNECVFIVVCSHGHPRVRGSEYDIRCSDGQLISDLEILSYFSNNSLPQLIGIPKIIVFQTCRGYNTDYVFTSVSEQTDGTPAAPGADAARRLPAQLVAHPQFTDMLIAYSTLPGNVSYRNHELGSWYIQTLCDVFAARAHDTHVVTMFSFVDQRMREKYGKQTSSVTNWGFNRRLYLHPGLFDDQRQETP